MAKRKSEPSIVSEQEVVAKFRKMVQELKEGKISRDEFIARLRSQFGVRGKGILRSFLRQRELARGWDSKPKTKKSSSQTLL